MIRSAMCVGSAFGAMVVLQGCGGGGDTPKSTPAPTPPPTPPPPPTTTTTLSLGPTGQPYCEDISTFYAKHFEDGAETAHGQCKPSVSPGAFYTAPGETDPGTKNDKSWSCWGDDFPKFNRNNKEAKAQGFAGACEMRDWGNPTKPDQVPYCSTIMDHHPASCTPGPQQYWGACYSQHTENWLCIPKDSELIPGYALGDCKSSV